MDNEFGPRPFPPTGEESRRMDEVAKEDVERVQCPNCCRLAPVTRRDRGLRFYRCELCFTEGAVDGG
jgi:hypothetical protein